MSVQNEIERINNNVQAALSAVADAGVSVPENANSNDLPAAVSALANEKQDKLTGAHGQIVGFGPDGKAVAQDKPTYAASEVGAIPTTEKGAANGVATLGADALLVMAQRPKASGLYRDDGNTTLEKSLTDISTTLANKADASHEQGANTITAGTFAGQVVSGSNYQSPSAMLLRNSKLVSAEENPTVNGEITWLYG